MHRQYHTGESKANIFRSQGLNLAKALTPWRQSIWFRAVVGLWDPSGAALTQKPVHKIRQIASDLLYHGLQEHDGTNEMIVDIPDETMRQKLEHLLTGIPGKFSHHPKRLSGLDQLILFRNKGISCPQFTVQLEDAKKWVKDEHQIFGRNKWHAKGTDIVDQRSPAWEGKDFWTKVIPKEREYRIHIFDDQHIQQGLKYFDPNAPRERKDDLPIWNTQTGYKYDHNFEPPTAGVDLARRAAKTLGYLWGAVDLLEDKSGTCYALEVNTAPGMDETTAHAYGCAIKEFVAKRKSSL